MEGFFSVLLFCVVFPCLCYADYDYGFTISGASHSNWLWFRICHSLRGSGQTSSDHLSRFSAKL